MPPFEPPTPPMPPAQDATTNPWMKLLLLVGGIALASKLVAPSRPRVFVSYDHEKDLRYRNLLRAWDANPKFPFAFDLTSPVARINSEDEAVVKRALTTKLKASDYLLVIVGSQTWRSAFVRWEIERAQEADIDLRLVAVKLTRTHRTPPALLDAGTAWAHQFTVEAVTAALRKAGEA
jgi:hypothetical protein